MNQTKKRKLKKDMKLLTIAIPSYNSHDYLRNAIDSMMIDNDELEVLVIDDGSKDDTLEIGKEYEKKYPGIVRAIHKENGGHGDAVMTGIKNASGLFFKVVDSDDWLDSSALKELMGKLKEFNDSNDMPDAVITNFVYDRVCTNEKNVVDFHKVLPVGKFFGWEDTKKFKTGQYILMHSLTYRTSVLRDCNFDLPKHTYYVDELYCTIPLKLVEKMYYLNVCLYHYYIGRCNQSVQEQVMIKNIDQSILVNTLVAEGYDPYIETSKKKRKYLIEYIEILYFSTSVLLIISKNKENKKKVKAFWKHLKEINPRLYKKLSRSFKYFVLHFPYFIIYIGYRISRKIYKFS